MSEQPINQWNMTTEPSDMMKINTPMPITVAPRKTVGKMLTRMENFV